MFIESLNDPNRRFTVRRVSPTRATLGPESRNTLWLVYVQQVRPAEGGSRALWRGHVYTTSLPLHNQDSPLEYFYEVYS